MIYYSKKDAWLVALVSGAIIVPVLIGVYHLFAPGGNIWVAGFTLLIGACTGAIILWLTYPLYYEIASGQLTIRCGRLNRQQIPLNSIEQVSPTKNPFGAPAWSLDRLEISYQRDGKNDVTLISPQDKLAFMRELVDQGSGLEMRGERVVRSP
jgi:PH (Pleckstrin Homology) domain-containing protein